MIKPGLPTHEQERLNALKQYSILDTLPEAEYDDITILASHVCQTPISLISLVDEKRQWFKSKQGLSASSTPRDVSFCAHAILNQDQILVVPDSRNDKRFHDNPLVTGDPHVVFYAGIPLVNPDGHSLGTLCVIDSKPRQLSDDQISALKALSRQLMKLFELRKSFQQVKTLNTRLEHQNEGLKNFAGIAAHDIKSPLATITIIADLLKNEYADKINDKGRELIGFIGDSSKQLTGLIDGILEYSKNTSLIGQKKEIVNLEKMLLSMMKLIDPEQKATINLTLHTQQEVFTNYIALEQIFLNLLTNAIKYNDKDHPEISISIAAEGGFLHVLVKDNGLGIPEEDRERIFGIFQTTSNLDKNGSNGTGIGLATVKSLVEGLGGNIRVISEPGNGSDFEFTIRII
ncbi:MAG: ATP-binding protein [Bacteroidota bacterium]